LQPVTVLSAAVSALIARLSLNTLTMHRLRTELANAKPRVSVDDSAYTWAEWRTTDLFPRANGFVKLGKQGRTFGVSMFHQMHCLMMIRKAVIEKDSADSHTHHCLNFIRQAILCASDTTLDPLRNDGHGKLRGSDGVSVVHVCRDWEKVYDYVRMNQMSEVWNSTST
ncbi:hypothetical protein BV22DRAFT_1040402, partial [Leucogyrophana mollusca]